MSILIHISVAVVRDDKLLLVQEAKQVNRGLWNLPGGHLEVGETLHDGAIREVQEETGLNVTLTGIVGIYTSIRHPDRHSHRFVFHAHAPTTAEPFAGDDILTVQWATLAEIAARPDAEFVAPHLLRPILKTLQTGRLLPLETLTEIVL